MLCCVLIGPTTLPKKKRKGKKKKNFPSHTP